VVFFRTHAGAATRAYKKTVWDAYAAQVVYTDAFSVVMGRYQNELTDAQRRAWAEFGITFPHRTSINAVRPLSPAQAYMRTNYPLWSNAGLRLDDPPANMDVLQPRSCGILTNTHAPQALTVTVDPQPTATELLLLALTPPLSPAKLRFHSETVIIEKWQGPLAPPYDVYTDWKAFFDTRPVPSGTLVAGQRIGLEAYFMNLANGALSQKVCASSLTGEATMYTAKFTLSSAQIKTLFSSPTQVIPTPGAGKAILVHKCLAYHHFLTTEYTITQGSELTLGPTAYPTNFQHSGPLNYLINYPGNVIRILVDTSMTWAPQHILNSGLTAACTLADPTLGDGTLELVIQYTIATP
jgi:hypothetical protein